MTLQVLDVNGSAFARGAAQGEAVGEAVRVLGSLDFYRRYCEAEAVAGSLPVARHLMRGLHSLTASRLSPDGRKLIAGYCAASGDDAVGIAHSLVMPDVLNFLIGSTARLSGAPSLGCTSIVAWGDHTRGGRFLVGRNLDFLGNGLYDQLPVVVRSTPDRGIPYVSIGTAGCVLDGVTGINAEGVSVAIHQHQTLDVTCAYGRPVLDLGREILQQAKSLDEARLLAERHRTGSGWSLVVTDSKRRRAGVIHRTPSRTYFHEPPGTALSFANTFAEPTMRARELGAPAFRESSRLRERRSAVLLENGRGRLDVLAFAQILRDHWDPERRRLRGFAQTIAQPNNLTSVIFDYENGVAWVAEGPAPACEGNYRKIELWSQSAPGETLEGLTTQLSEDQQNGCRAYERAMSCWERNREPREPYAHLDAAVKADPDDAAYWYMKGLFALKLGDERGAVASFEAGISRPDLEHRSQAQKLWLARAYDLLGKRSQATPLYAYVCERSMYGPLARAASRGLSRAYATPVVFPDLFHADARMY